MDVSDLAIVGAQWGTDGPDADLNEDGTVDVGDLAIVGSNWTNLAFAQSIGNDDQNPLVPEPMTVSLLLTSLICLGRRTRRRRPAH